MVTVLLLIQPPLAGGQLPCIILENIWINLEIDLLLSRSSEAIPNHDAPSTILNCWDAVVIPAFLHGKHQVHSSVWSGEPLWGSAWTTCLFEDFLWSSHEQRWLPDPVTSSSL